MILFYISFHELVPHNPLVLTASCCSRKVQWGGHRLRQLVWHWTGGVGWVWFPSEVRVCPIGWVETLVLCLLIRWENVPWNFWLLLLLHCVDGIPVGRAREWILQVPSATVIIFCEIKNKSQSLPQNKMKEVWQKVKWLDLSQYWVSTYKWVVPDGLLCLRIPKLLCASLDDQL
jgi:hypothetical protein